MAVLFVRMNCILHPENDNPEIVALEFCESRIFGLYRLEVVQTIEAWPLPFNSNNCFC